MRKRFASLAVVLLGVALFAQGAFAASNVKIGLNNAYHKPNGTYAVVVKDVPGVHLALYVNDKNPVYATVNNKNWATFYGVKLPSDNGKISFGRIFNTKGKSYQLPLRYVRYFSIANSEVSFLVTNPVEAVKTPDKNAQQGQSEKVTTAPQPAPTQPTCTNGTYVNSAGNTVCSPESAPSAPAGATAQCVDGTYSFSQSHSGTCSHHGGVAQWL